MILCSCSKTIKYFVAIAHAPYTPPNKTGRPVIISNGAYFACVECCDRIVKSWQRHNESRTQPYEIQTVKISVRADTKKDFEKRVQPQIFNQFDWFVPKTAIKQALTKTIKVK